MWPRILVVKLTICFCLKLFELLVCKLLFRFFARSRRRVGARRFAVCARRRFIRLHVAASAFALQLAHCRLGGLPTCRLGGDNSRSSERCVFSLRPRPSLRSARFSVGGNCK